MIALQLTNSISPPGCPRPLADSSTAGLKYCVQFEDHRSLTSHPVILSAEQVNRSWKDL